jgi:hypothetical protein
MRCVWADGIDVLVAVQLKFVAPLGLVPGPSRPGTRPGSDSELVVITLKREKMQRKCGIVPDQHPEQCTLVH